jgi:hypothetical protein
MCAAVIPCVTAYLLIHAFGKEVLNDAYFGGPFSHTLSPTNFVCMSTTLSLEIEAYFWGSYFFVLGLNFDS